MIRYKRSLSIQSDISTLRTRFPNLQRKICLALEALFIQTYSEDYIRNLPLLPGEEKLQ